MFFLSSIAVGFGIYALLNYVYTLGHRDGLNYSIEHYKEWRDKLDSH